MVRSSRTASERRASNLAQRRRESVAVLVAHVVVPGGEHVFELRCRLLQTRLPLGNHLLHVERELQPVVRAPDVVLEPAEGEPALGLCGGHACSRGSARRVELAERIERNESARAHDHDRTPRVSDGQLIVRAERGGAACLGRDREPDGRLELKERGDDRLVELRFGGRDAVLSRAKARVALSGPIGERGQIEERRLGRLGRLGPSRRGRLRLVRPRHQSERRRPCAHGDDEEKRAERPAHLGGRL